VAFKADGEPALFAGESKAEALNDDRRHFEQSVALVPEGEGRWISEHPLAFQYVRITGAEPSELECRAQLHPARYRGAFACSDERLTRIWMQAAYTHRLNLSDFVLDGIKRDRLPWVDNMILSAMVESYVFADPELLRRTLTVMGRTADSSDINGIIDYNFLWIIAQEELQRHFPDRDFLAREWPRRCCPK
jgi:alpha-L-rhamnosidase